MNGMGATEVIAAGGRLLSCELHIVRELTGGQHAVTLLATDGAKSYVVRAFRTSPQQ